MTDRGYLLHKPPAPGAWKRALNQQVLPVAIDAATLLETGAEAIARRVRRRPGAGLGLAVLAGCGIALLLPRRGRRQSRSRWGWA